MTIRKLQPHEPYPMDLLLLADPEEQAVHSYIQRSTCYVEERQDEIVGVYALLPTRPKTVELINIAVKESWQGKGIGKQLIIHAIRTAKELDCLTIEVGTGNSSIGQLYLYQKCGFRMAGIDIGYFTRHYKEPIFENGLQCTDMVRLRLDV